MKRWRTCGQIKTNVRSILQQILRPTKTPGKNREAPEEQTKLLQGHKDVAYANLLLYGACNFLKPKGYVLPLSFGKEILYVEKFVNNGKTYIFIAPASKYTADRTKYLEQKEIKITIIKSKKWKKPSLTQQKGQ